MNLTIHERHGGGFCVRLDAPAIGECFPRDKDGELRPGRYSIVESPTLTLTFGSVNAPPVTFETFSDLQRVLHGEVRLALERLDP